MNIVLAILGSIYVCALAHTVFKLIRKELLDVYDKWLIGAVLLVEILETVPEILEYAN